MARHKRTNSSIHYAPGSFITILCTAASHEEWGLKTFLRASDGWMESGNLQLLGDGGAPGSAGPQLWQRGDALAGDTVRLTASGEVVPEIAPGDYDWTNPDHRAAAAKRDEPGTYDRLQLRCPRCGDNLPLRWGTLTAALDAMTTRLPERHFYRLTELRSVVKAISR